MLRNAAVLTLGLATLTAQESLTARHFLPQDYKTVLFVDLAAMRDRDIWADLEVSVLKLLFGQLEKELGFPLDDLDRLTMVMDLGEPKAGGMASSDRRDVRVLEGNKPLPVHESMLTGRWQQERIGKYDAYRRSTIRDRVFFQPRPEMQVGGTTSMLRPAMEGKRGASAPSADVMSLLSGRGAKLAYFVIDVGHPVMQTRFFGDVMPDTEWPEDDTPTFFCVRLLATGDEDDPHLTIEAVMRHQKAGKGIEVTEAALDRMLAEVKKNPQLRLINSVLKKIEKRRDGSDLNLRLDLGRARNAVGQLATLLVPFFLMAAEPQVIQAQAAELEVVEPPPPPPPEPPKKAKKPKRNGGR